MNDWLVVLGLAALIVGGFALSEWDPMPLTAGGRAQRLAMRVSPALACRVYCGPSRDGTVVSQCDRCRPVNDRCPDCNAEWVELPNGCQEREHEVTCPYINDPEWWRRDPEVGS